jgi:hypothetical protein
MHWATSAPGNRVLLELFAQSGAIQTENFGSAALIATAMNHHFLQQRRLDLGQYGVIQITARGVTHVLQVPTYHASHDIFQTGLGFGIGGGAVDEVQGVHERLRLTISGRVV